MPAARNGPVTDAWSGYGRQDDFSPPSLPTQITICLFHGFGTSELGAHFFAGGLVPQPDRPVHALFARPGFHELRAAARRDR